MRLPLFFLAALLGLAACDSAPLPAPSPEPEPPIVAGVDLDRLLAPPTPAEHKAVADTFAARAQALVPEDVRLEATRSDGEATLEVLSFSVPGGTGRFYGAVHLPATPPGSQERLPLLVVVPSEEDAVRPDDFLTERAFAGVGDAFVQVLFAPPGRALAVGETTYTSAALPASLPALYDYEVDLTRAFLKTVFDRHEDELDDERIGAVGFGRGGTVALLLAARPASAVYPFAPAAVAALAPFTDYAAPSFRTVVRDLLLDRPSPFPGAEDLATRYLRPLRDRLLPVEDVREALLRRSPLYFSDALPDVLLLHGSADAVIGSDHTARLVDHVRSRATFDFLSEVGHDALFEDPVAQSVLASYLLNRLGD